MFCLDDLGVHNMICTPGSASLHAYKYVPISSSAWYSLANILLDLLAIGPNSRAQGWYKKKVFFYLQDLDSLNLEKLKKIQLFTINSRRPKNTGASTSAPKNEKSWKINWSLDRCQGLCSNNSNITVNNSAFKHYI